MNESHESHGSSGPDGPAPPFIPAQGGPARRTPPPDGPAEDGAAPETVTQVAVPEGAPARADQVRVLVVDDTADVRMLVGFLIEDEPSWTLVAEAANGLEAIARAEATKPDLVLMDVSMPVMDGLEALPRLRRLLPDSVLVLLTAFPLGEVSDLAEAYGADACLDKVDMATSLVSDVSRLLQTHARRASSDGRPVSGDGRED